MSATVDICRNGKHLVSFTPEAMAAFGGETFPIADRVPEAEGVAFDFLAWFRTWSASGKYGFGEDGGHGDNGSHGAKEPTHMRVEAADEFQATLPWEELRRAAILFRATDGGPLRKGFPIRLYVPDGNSNCLNVKSIVRVDLLDAPELGSRSSFGYKNTVSLDQLKKPKG